MFSKEINELSIELEKIETRFDEFDISDIGSDEYEKMVSKVYELEEKISEFIDYQEESHFSLLKKLKKRIVHLKNENDFYDEDAELDRMFPNRYDDDFDEDSMSYDSVFGDD